MLRIFFFLLLVLLLGFGFSWFADRPGDVALQWQGNQYETSLMVVLVALVALVAAIMILWWLANTILDSPRIMQRFFKARKQDRGYKALSRGLIAANSGDAVGARKFTKESVKLLGHEPLVDLLDAQSCLLEGNRDEARKRFETMLEDDETRLVALRGLYVEAERQGAGEAARHYAQEANKEAPSLAWAGNAKLRFASMDGDWEAALATLEANKSAGLIDKDAAKRQRAVLLTAQAMSEEPADPVKAAKLAKEAHKLAPDLVPAAIIGAKALARNSDIGRASGMLEAVWKKEPHPELAQAYIHIRMGDSAADRLKRAKKLAAMKANHPEGNFIIAEAAIDVQDWKLARETMVPVLNTAPTERACLIMADIEEGQSGDQGRMRDWLSRAVRAPKDAAWTADGHVSENWLPISPISGKLDAFEWKRPVEQLGGPQVAVLDSDGLDDLISEPKKAPVKAKAPKSIEREPDAKPVGAGAKGFAASAPNTSDKAPQIETVETPEKSAPVDENEDVEEIDEKIAEAAVIEAENVVVGDKPATEDKTVTEEVASEEKPEPSVAEKPKAKQSSSNVTEKGHQKKEDLFPLDRRPDDPGVRDGDGPKKPKRFGLF